MYDNEKIRKLAVERPDVAFRVERDLDETFVWDGDGPDPVEDGYYPYDVTVTAFTIRNGEVIEGTSTLGGSYYGYDEEIGEVHGYLPQMVDEALAELDKELAKCN